MTNWSLSIGLYPVLALYDVVKYLCLEMGIFMIYMNEIIPQGWSVDRNFRPLQNARNM